MIVSKKLKEMYRNTKCTLNGYPARIVGRDYAFPKVVDIKTGLSAEWSWNAVHSVITNKNGEFQS